MEGVIYHRFRFYQGRFSNFDLVEPCGKPGRCQACAIAVPLCDARGRVHSGDELVEEACRGSDDDD